MAFPSNPVNGQIYKDYIYNSNRWVKGDNLNVETQSYTDSGSNSGTLTKTFTFSKPVKGIAFADANCGTLEMLRGTAISGNTVVLKYSKNGIATMSVTVFV